MNFWAITMPRPLVTPVMTTVRGSLRATIKYLRSKRLPELEAGRGLKQVRVGGVMSFYGFDGQIHPKSAFSWMFGRPRRLRLSKTWKLQGLAKPQAAGG